MESGTYSLAFSLFKEYPGLTCVYQEVQRSLRSHSNKLKRVSQTDSLDYYGFPLYRLFVLSFTHFFCTYTRLFCLMFDLITSFCCGHNVLRKVTQTVGVWDDIINNIKLDCSISNAKLCAF